MGAAYCILGIGLLSTALVCQQLKRQLAFREQARFEEVSDATVQAVQLHVRSHMGLLQAIRGLYLAEPGMTQTQWTNFFKSVPLKEGFPGLIDVSVIARVPDFERKRHVTSMRQKGLINYHLWPELDQKEFFPVVYSYPAQPALARELTGWDASSDPDCRLAMESARDTSRPVSTGTASLPVQDVATAGSGFMLFLPIYGTEPSPKTTADRSATLRGFVASTYLPEKLWEDVVEHTRRPSVRVEILEGSRGFGERSFTATTLASRTVGTTEYSRQVRAFGHTWTLRFSPLPGFERSTTRHITLLTLASGVSISLLLFAIAWTQARAHQHSQALGLELQESEDRLRHTNVQLQKKIVEGDKVQQELAAAHDLARTQQERLLVTLRSIGEAVISTDVESRIVLFNETAERLTQWTSTEALGRPLGEVFQLRQRQAQQPVDTGVITALQHGQTVSSEPGTVLAARDGRVKSVSVTAAPIRAENDKIVGAVLVARDVTERERLESELARARRLESTAILARGLAHDFNTLLTGILGNVSVARMFAATDATLDERLSHAEKSCLRAKELTERLLTFAQTGPAAGRPVSISELLRDTAHLALSGTACECECSYPSDLWPVQIEESQICQVIYDLVTNASQAMPVGGRIGLVAQNVMIQSGGPVALPPGRYIQIDVRDEGAGITPEHLSKVFDPYFTTKQRGSGLGLASAYFIVQRHEGLIQVDSELGAGTTFRLYLPAARISLANTIEPPFALPGLNGRILLMDDEMLILNLGAVVLKRLGYDVTLARDGEEAVQRFEEARGTGRPFSAVILDLVVQGGLGGDEAVKRLLRIDPAVKAVVSSGYHNDPVMTHYQEHGFVGAITKPYHAADLAKLLTKVLKASG